MAITVRNRKLVRCASNRWALGALIAASSLSIANAGEFKGIIAEVNAGPSLGTKVLIKMQGTETVAQPGCNTDYYDFAFDSSTTVGRSLLSIVLTAQASGQNVTVRGEGIFAIHRQAQ